MSRSGEPVSRLLSSISINLESCMVLIRLLCIFRSCQWFAPKRVGYVYVICYLFKNGRCPGCPVKITACGSGIQNHDHAVFGSLRREKSDKGSLVFPVPVVYICSVVGDLGRPGFTGNTVTGVIDPGSCAVFHKPLRA